MVKDLRRVANQPLSRH